MVASLCSRGASQQGRGLVRIKGRVIAVKYREVIVENNSRQGRRFILSSPANSRGTSVDKSEGSSQSQAPHRQCRRMLEHPK